MTKCSRVGCDNEGQRYQVPVLGGAFYADAYFCSDHKDEGLKSLVDAQ